MTHGHFHVKRKQVIGQMKLSAPALCSSDGLLCGRIRWTEVMPITCFLDIPTLPSHLPDVISMN